ncbi:MAG: type II secretion system F family protein [Candidatus Nezhaarchaeales archaeon]
MNGRFFSPRQKAATYFVAIASAVAIFYLPFYLKLYTPAPPIFIPTSQLVNSIFCVGILVLCLIVGVVEDLEHRWKRGIEKGVSQFIRDLVDYVRTGVPLTIALKECAKNRYGPLSKELNRVVAKMMLGFDPEISIIDIAKMARTPLMDKVSILLVEVMRSGAKALNILQSFLTLHSALESYETEKETELKSYTWIMYVSFVVYLLTVYILMTQLVTPLTLTEGFGEIVKGFRGIDFYKAIFFYCGVIEAIAAGLAIGKISKGSMLTGLRHSALMLAVLILVFTQLL